MIIPAESQSLNDIFTHLCYNLVKRKYEKEITSKSTPIHADVFGNSSVLIDPLNTENQHKDNFHTANTLNSFVSFHLRTIKLIVTDYTLQGRTDDATQHFPLTWKLEGSNNNEDWTLLHTQPSTQAIVGQGKKATFKTTVQMPFQNFKLTHLGTTNLGAGNYYFVLRRIEFFGKVIMKNDITNRCRTSKITSLIYIMTLIISC